MKINFPEKLKLLAERLDKPLYAVGGVVRNFLIDNSLATDVDLAGAMDQAEVMKQAEAVGFVVKAEYKRTGTVMFSDGEYEYEYTTFRKESYRAGEHRPISVTTTDNIEEDARRRDFKCNAIYYDISKDLIVDVLGGVKDLAERRLDTVIEPEKVFSCDGLRLMRLARFSGELNFKPMQEVIKSAKKFSHNILDISKERIFSELKKILLSDCRYPFSDKLGHYTGLKILEQTLVLDKIIPELTLGRGMEQRKDYHAYDVLEHSLRCVMYSDKSVRLSSLLHDVAKPFCKLKYGEFKLHGVEGERLAKEILVRLKADKQTVKQVSFMAKAHMVDLDLKMRESKVRVFIVENFDYFEKLLAVKQADFSACKDSKEECPTVKKWREIYQNMIDEKTPFCLKDLKISSADLIKKGFKGEQIAKTLKKIFLETVINPKLNEREKLIRTLDNIK